MTVSLVDPVRGVWGLYNSAMAADLAALGPGVVLIDGLMRAAAEEGCTALDLLRGTRRTSTVSGRSTASSTP